MLGAVKIYDFLQFEMFFLAIFLDILNDAEWVRNLNDIFKLWETFQMNN